jgi:hypothetical protein
VIKSLGLALAAAFALSTTAMAAPAAPAPETKIDPANHDTGKKEVPAVVAAAGVPCTVTDGYYVGQSDTKDDKGVVTKTKIYEASCQNAMGLILLAPATGTPKIYDCVTITQSPTLRCRLPGNTDPKTAIGPYVAAAGKTCQVSGVRPVGSTPAGDTFYEVGCTGALGFILKHSVAGQVTANDCAQAVGTNLECQLTTKEQIQAGLSATVNDIVAKSGKTCTVSGSRLVGADSAGNVYYEVACGSAGGYMMSTDKAGAFHQAINCANADALAGGCKLTDATTAQTQEVGTYTRLAKSAGFPCQVSKYHYIGTDSKGAEIVELACSNRPDGGIAVLPGDNSPGHVLDCVQAGSLGQSCHLSDPAVNFPKYTNALAAKGKGSCKVSNARWIGRTSTSDYVETACSDGLPGWVIEMTPNGQAGELLSCGQAKGAGITCALPGNAK